MLPRQPVPAALQTLADCQAGVVSREQSLSLGLSRHALRRLTTSGLWRRLSPGIYFCLASDPPWLAWAWAGVLIGGDHARVGGLAAAYLHGLVEECPRRILVFVPATSFPRVDGPWWFRREQPGCRQPRRIGAPPRTDVEDTVLDLVAQETDEQRVVGWVTGAVQARRTTPDRLLRRLDDRSRMPHRQILRALLADVAEGARSPLEVRFLRDVERAHGLPTGGRQVRRRQTECDVWYRDFGLLVELDGRRGHEGVGAFRDMWRDNLATSDGLSTLRYGYRDVFGSPCEVASQVAQNLADRGWPGPFVRCVNCRRAA